MIKTNSADSTIADSAPASTAFACGIKSIKGFVGVDRNTKPHISVMDAARLEKKMSTGIVVTSIFPDATPADFICHFPNRNCYDTISTQFVFNSPDVVFGGGEKYFDIIKNNLKSDFPSKIKLITSSDEFLMLKPETVDKTHKIWGLFKNYLNQSIDMSYNCDRINEPSLSEMTEKAIDILKQNPNGFFLIVEGSLVDFGAHANDPYAAVTDFIEFDKAVGKALNFAKSNDKTIVIVCADHANGGMSIGSNNNYANINLYNNTVKPLKFNVKHSAFWIVNKIKTIDDTIQLRKIIYENYFIDIKGYDINKLKNNISDSTEVYLGRMLSKKINLAWTTTGHTGEDVFLGIYSPKFISKISGIVDNTEIAFFINKALKLDELDKITGKYFYDITKDKQFINTGDNKYKYNGNDYEFFPNTYFYKKNGQKLILNSLILKIKQSLYVPKEILINN